MSVLGLWNIKIFTPIGTQRVTLDLHDNNGILEGFAKDDNQTAPLVEPELNGNHLIWKQSITKPLRLNLVFDVTFDGDSLSGTSKTKGFPASKVTGARAV